MVNFLCVLIMILTGTVRCLTFSPIGSTDDKNSFECNTNVSLVCQTQHGQDIIILEINNTQLVNCVTRCYVNTPFLGKYIVTHDFDAGIIRLDIPTITDADASNEFICRGDSTALSIKPVIKVFPEKSSTQLTIHETNSTDVVEINVLTGCVLLTTNLSFVWNKTKYSNGIFLEPLSEEHVITKSTYSEQASNCIPSDNCGGQAHSSTLKFTKETSGGLDYFITCTIVFDENVTGNESRKYAVVSERSFTLKVLCRLKVLRNIFFQEDKIYKGTLIWIGTILLQLVIFTVVARFSQQSKEDCIDPFSCWAIFLIILSIVIILLVVCLVFIILEPVRDVTVFDRPVQGGQMVVKLQWKARCFYLKKFYAEFESEINQSFMREMNYTPRYDGSLECVIGGLSLENDYQAHIHSRICCIRSLWKTIVFDTTGRPLPPQSVCEKEQQRTESSVTLTWISAKGHTDQFYIKYKRKKGKKN